LRKARVNLKPILMMRLSPFSGGLTND
jgi:hypothetical protein